MNIRIPSMFFPITPIDTSLRYERKYLVPNYLLDELRERIRPFVNHDSFSLDTDFEHIKQYTVRSIYFDSHNLKCYDEKGEGLMMRRKLRIRSYNQPEPNKIAIVEIKRKIGNRVKKNRANILFENANQLLNYGKAEELVVAKNEKQKAAFLEDTSRFLFHYHKGRFKPSCLITYEREAFHYKFDSTVRITFDKNIRSLKYPVIEDLFEEARLKHLFKSHFILEIKYGSERMPRWIKSIVHEFRLRNDALSKYAIGLEVHHAFTF